MYHACSFASNLRGGIITAIVAISLVLQESVSLKSAVRLFPVMVRVDWKQEQFILCCSKMLILGIIEEKGSMPAMTWIGIATSVPKKDPFQNNTSYFIFTTHVKITRLGSNDALKQSALDVTIGESVQSMQVLSA